LLLITDPMARLETSKGCHVTVSMSFLWLLGVDHFRG